VESSAAAASCGMGGGGPMTTGEMLRHSTWLGGEWVRDLFLNR